MVLTDAGRPPDVLFAFVDDPGRLIWARGSALPEDTLRLDVANAPGIYS